MQKTSVLTPDFVQPDGLRLGFERAARAIGEWAHPLRREESGAAGGVSRSELARLLESSRVLGQCTTVGELLDRVLSDLLVFVPCREGSVALIDAGLCVTDVRSTHEDSVLCAGQVLSAAMQRALREPVAGGATGVVPLRGANGVCGLIHIVLEGSRAERVAQWRRAESFAEVAVNAYDSLRMRLRAVQAAEEAAAEKERARLSRDLHDSVSQALFGVSMGVRTGLEMLPATEQAREPIAFALDLADAAFAEMRALIFEMRSDCLHEEGVLRGLRRQCAAIIGRHKAEFGADLTIRLSEAEPEMPAPLREAMYRIAVEALQNAGKHARATEIVVDLAADAASITMTIRDDGRGFDPDATYHGHLGLKSMRERAALAGAALEFESAPGCGTCITVRAAQPTPQPCPPADRTR
jgi:signal transduction histidine kinase